MITTGTIKRANIIHRIYPASPLHDPDAMRTAANAVQASGGHVAMVVHPLYFRYFTEKYHSDPLEGFSKNYKHEPYSLETYAPYEARLKAFIASTDLPMFIFIGTNSDARDYSWNWKDWGSPPYLDLSGVKNAAFLVPTTDENPAPLMRLKLTIDRQWEEFLGLAVALGVKEIDKYVGEMSYRTRPNGTRLSRYGCYEDGLKWLATRFPVFTDMDLSFPNTIFDMSAMDLLDDCLSSCSNPLRNEYLKQTGMYY